MIWFVRHGKVHTRYRVRLEVNLLIYSALFYIILIRSEKASGSKISIQYSLSLYDHIVPTRRHAVNMRDLTRNAHTYRECGYCALRLFLRPPL